MKIKRWAAVCLAAGCLLWSGTETGASRHLAEQRAAQERESRVMQEEEDRQRAWELAQEAADTEKARGETKAPADKTAEETPREAPADTGKTEAVGQSSAKAEEVAAAEAGADSTKDEKTAKREKKGARDEGVDDANGSLRSYLQRLREKADEILHPAEPNLRIRETRPMREWAAERSDSGGTLIFSDSPEYVKQAGILYTDELDGEARVLFYHLNQIKRPAKIALLMENTGERDAVIQLTRRGVSRPGEDYLAVGKATQAAYFSDGQKTEKLTIGTGERKLLMPELEALIMQPEQLIYGIADFSASAPVRLSVLICPAENDAIRYSRIAPILPKDEQRLRGTFQGMNRTIRARDSYDPGKDGTVYFTIGDDRTDRFLTGIDATDGSLVTNFGNYGVLYRVEVPIEGRRPLRAMLNPIGGAYAGVMRVQTAEKATARIVPTPLRGTSFGDGVKNPIPMRGDTPILDPGAAVADLGFYQRTRGISFEFSPPGASNLPTRIILMPEDTK